MTEETRNLMEEKLVQALEGLDQLEPGSKERQLMAEEVEALSKQLNEELKVQQSAWDNEETRRIDEDIRNKQADNERFRSKLDLAKGLGVATIGGAFSMFMGKAVMKNIREFDGAGILPNKEILKNLPKLKFW